MERRTSDTRAKNCRTLLRIQFLRKQTYILPIHDCILREEPKLAESSNSRRPILTMDVVDHAPLTLEATPVDVKEADRITLLEVDLVPCYIGAYGVL